MVVRMPSTELRIERAGRIYIHGRLAAHARAFSSRRSDQYSRPCAMTCCFVSRNDAGRATRPHDADGELASEHVQSHRDSSPSPRLHRTLPERTSAAHSRASGTNGIVNRRARKSPRLMVMISVFDSPQSYARTRRHGTNTFGPIMPSSERHQEDRTSNRKCKPNAVKNRA